MGQDAIAPQVAFTQSSPMVTAVAGAGGLAQAGAQGQ